MKVVNDKDVFVLPDHGLFLLSDNINTEKLIDTLTTFLAQKKKTKGILIDCEGSMIDQKDCSFIHISRNESVNQYFEFKPKTVLNNQLSEFVLNNARQFLSLENIRYELNELLTDQGIIRFEKILSADTGLDLELTTENFELSKILQCLRLEADYLTRSQKMMILYNLHIFLNRKKFRIVYVDCDVDSEMCSWLSKKKSLNSLILVNNGSILPPIKPVFDGLIKLSQYDFVDTYEISPEQTNLVSYLFHPVIQANMAFQSEKNIQFMKNFEDENTTFFLGFTSEYNA